MSLRNFLVILLHHLGFDFTCPDCGSTLNLKVNCNDLIQITLKERLK